MLPTDQILKGGAFNSTNIGGVGIGLIAIFFAILCFRLAKKKRNEENQS
jgi:mannose/fructose/N-acetylgalactosamine-specific phosphotransferase system component IIC